VNFDARILNACPDAIVATTAGGEVLSWSPGAESIFGFSADEAIGHAVAELIVPPDRRTEEDRILGQLPASGTLTYEAVRRRKDGSLLFVDVSRTRLPGDNEGRRAVFICSKSWALQSSVVWKALSPVW